MHIGEINKKYYEGYEGFEYIAFKIKEKNDTQLVLWEGYIDSIMEKQTEWKSGLSLDWCESIGPYDQQDEDIEVDSEVYLEDLNSINIELFSNRLFEINEVIDSYNSIIDFIKYVKDNNYTLIVNVGTDYQE